MSEFDTYDKDGISIDDLYAKLVSLQSRISSTISEVRREDGLLTEKQSQISQDVDEIKLEVFAIDQYGATISRIQQNADQISLKVASSDYNGNTIASLINQTATTIKIQASHIDLVGAVTVLSDITGDLGTITAGTITGVVINADAELNVETNATIGGQLNLGTSIGINDFKINFGNVADFTVWMGNSNEYYIDYNAFQHNFYGNVDFTNASVLGLTVTATFA